MLDSKEICLFLESQKYAYSYVGTVLKIEGFCSLSKPIVNAITWVKSGNIQNLCEIQHSSELLFVVDKRDAHVINENHHLILCDNPKEVFFGILKEFFVEREEKVIQRDSVIETSNIGKNVSIGHHCYIAKDVVIGSNVVIKNNVSIECPTVIGDNTVIGSGVVIGTSGFGYYQKEDLSYEAVPHFGGVIIGKNVDIGANTCIDRGTLDDTIIGDNVKIDNLCHIAHNVEIEKNSLIIALSLLGGSSKIGENVYIAPGAIIKNQIAVGRNSIIGMGAVVMNNVEKNLVVAGVPAKKIRFNQKL